MTPKDLPATIHSLECRDSRLPSIRPVIASSRALKNYGNLYVLRADWDDRMVEEARQAYANQLKMPMNNDDVVKLGSDAYIFSAIA